MEQPSHGYSNTQSPAEAQWQQIHSFFFLLNGIQSEESVKNSLTQTLVKPKIQKFSKN